MSPQSVLVDVAAEADIPERHPLIVNAGKRSIGLVRWDGHIYAIRNLCPHMGAPLCAGRVGPRMVSESMMAGVDVDESDPVVICPWHGWSFHLETGRSVHAPDRQRVRAYRTETRDGRVLIDID